MSDNGRGWDHGHPYRHQDESPPWCSGQWHYRTQEGHQFLAGASSSPHQPVVEQSSQQHSTTGVGVDPLWMHSSSMVAYNGSVYSSTSWHSAPMGDDPAANYDQSVSNPWSIRQYMAYSSHSSDAQNSIRLVDQRVPHHNSLYRHGNCPPEIEVSDDPEGDDTDDVHQSRSRENPKRKSKSKSTPKSGSSSKSGSGSGSRSSRSDPKSSKSKSRSSTSSTGSSRSGSGSGFGSKRSSNSEKY